MIEQYMAGYKVPESALQTITGGNLNGRSNINPQWKIDVMTEIYGLCGIGWKYEITKVETYPLANGEILIYMLVSVMVKNGEKWSEPVLGAGGDFIVKKNKNGLVPNDEAYKMCLTDALGNALKHIGIGGAIFRGMFDTKYNRYTRDAPEVKKISAHDQLRNMLKEDGIAPDDFAMVTKNVAFEKLKPDEVKNAFVNYTKAIEWYRKKKTTIDAANNEEIPMPEGA